MSSPKDLNRRSFLKKTSMAATGMIAVPQIVPSMLLGRRAPSKTLNIACIGLGGQMHSLMRDLHQNLHENIVAICDVDASRMRHTRADEGLGAGKANRYADYRELLSKEQSIDAVVVATPDHWHAAIATAALKAGKHVYCEKPLTHTVGQSRALRELANKSGLVTQTGNQGASASTFRRSIEVVQAGMLGSVDQVHIWHSAHNWPSGVNRPDGEDRIPMGLDWDFWLGPAPARPYKSEIYHPAKWRGWYDFGGGSLADFCCHGFSMPVRALELDYPTKIDVSGEHLDKESFPTHCRVQFDFPAKGNRKAVTIYFHSGEGAQPPVEVLGGFKETFGSIPTLGCILVGDQGTLSGGLWNNECYLRMKEEKKFKNGYKHEAVKSVPRTLPRARGGHMKEWVNACKGKGETFSNFEVGGHVTEIGSAGLIALQLGHGITWDGQEMVASEGQVFVDPAPRKDSEKYL